MNEIKLKVMEALQEEAYKGIVRIDSQTMKEIGVHPGDVLEIQGSRLTVGVVDRAYPTDVGQKIIRMDGILRRNAKTGIGENVKIKKADIKEAKQITIAPAQKNVIIRTNSDYLFKKTLLGRAMVVGDIVVPGGSPRRRIVSDPFFDDIFSPSDDFFGGSFGFGSLRFMVVSTNPKSQVIITENTQVILSPKAIEITEEKIPEVTYEDIGGLSEEITKIREMVELPLKHPEIFNKLGIEPPKGVLLHGPPGTGKTLLAKAVANESEANFILVNGPEIVNKFYGESEKKVREIFENAEKQAPSIIFFDEIDAIAPKREETYGELERRMVSQLLTQMDGLKSRGKVVVIGATNRPNALDPALRRPGRFDREITLSVPNKKGRLNILKIHTRNMPIRGKMYPDILKKNFNNQFPELINKYDLDIENLFTKEKQIINKIKKLEEDIPQQKTELNRLYEDFKYLKSKLNQESVIQSIINKLNNLKNNIKKLELEISEKEDIIKNSKNSLKEYTKEIKEIKEKRNKISNLKESLSSNKKLVNKLLDDLLKIYSVKKSIEKYDSDDPRKILIEKFKNLNENEKKLLNQIFELEIISESLINKTRQMGVPRDLEKLAEITHGFVGADISALCKEAAMSVLRRMLPDINLDEEKIQKEILEKLIVIGDDFKQALKLVRPSALREVLIETPNVKWEDVGGAKDIEQELKEAIEWPLKHPNAFKRIGVSAPKGILIYGPPGIGKTLLAKAVANESEANFILVRGPELMNKYIGESEKGVRKVFEKARQASPTILFFDELDSLAPRRGLSNDSQVTERVVNTLLSEMDGLVELNDVVVLAATNRPDMIDPALLRPGRFDRLLFVGAPSKEERLDIFKIHTKDMPLAKDVNLNKLADKTEGYTGADIEAIAREAGLLALRKDIKSKIVNNKFFEEALKKVRPSVTKELLAKYKAVEENYLRQAKAAITKEIPSYMG